MGGWGYGVVVIGVLAGRWIVMLAGCCCVAATVGPRAHATPAAGPPPVIRTGDATLTYGLKISGRVVYPITDGYLDEARVQFFPTTTVDAELRVEDAQGGLVDSHEERRGRTLRTFVWVGRTADGSIVKPGIYKLTFTLTDAENAARLFSATWTVEVERRVETKNLVVTLPVETRDVITRGTCLATPSTQVRGVRIQCFGDPGSRATVRLVFNSTSYSFGGVGASPVVIGVGKPHVFGRGSYESAVAKVASHGLKITVSIVVTGHQAADISKVEVPFAYRYTR